MKLSATKYYIVKYQSVIILEKGPWFGTYGVVMTEVTGATPGNQIVTVVINRSRGVKVSTCHLRKSFVVGDIVGVNMKKLLFDRGQSMEFVNGEVINNQENDMYTILLGYTNESIEIHVDYLVRMDFNGYTGRREANSDGSKPRHGDEVQMNRTGFKGTILTVIHHDFYVVYSYSRVLTAFPYEFTYPFNNNLMEQNSSVKKTVSPLRESLEKSQSQQPHQQSQQPSVMLPPQTTYTRRQQVIAQLGEKKKISGVDFDNMSATKEAIRRYQSVLILQKGVHYGKRGTVCSDMRELIYGEQSVGVGTLAGEIEVLTCNLRKQFVLGDLVLVNTKCITAKEAHKLKKLDNGEIIAILENDMYTVNLEKGIGRVDIHVDNLCVSYEYNGHRTPLPDPSLPRHFDTITLFSNGEEAIIECIVNHEFYSVSIGVKAYATLPGTFAIHMRKEEMISTESLSSREGMKQAESQVLITDQRTEGFPQYEDEDELFERSSYDDSEDDSENESFELNIPKPLPSSQPISERLKQVRKQANDYGGQANPLFFQKYSATRFYMLMYQSVHMLQRGKNSGKSAFVCSNIRELIPGWESVAVRTMKSEIEVLTRNLWKTYVVGDRVAVNIDHVKKAREEALCFMTGLIVGVNLGNEYMVCLDRDQGVINVDVDDLCMNYEHNEDRSHLPSDSRPRQRDRVKMISDGKRGIIECVVDHKFYAVSVGDDVRVVESRAFSVIRENVKTNKKTDKTGKEQGKSDSSARSVPSVDSISKGSIEGETALKQWCEERIAANDIITWRSKPGNLTCIHEIVTTSCPFQVKESVLRRLWASCDASIELKHMLLNATCGEYEDTALHMAGRRNDKKMAVLLLELGASAMATNKIGNVPTSKTTAIVKIYKEARKKEKACAKTRG